MINFKSLFSHLGRTASTKLTNRRRVQHLVLALTLLLVGGHATVFGQSNYATPYTFTTFAGAAGSIGYADGTGSGASFYADQGVAVDGSGNVYVADTENDTIRKITPAGVVSTLAGQPQTTGTTDGSGSAALFNGPTGVAVDGSGNVYVADQYNDTIRKVTPAGVVSTLAGSAGNSGSTNGSGSSAKFSQPAGVAVDGSGNIYVADDANNVIRKITAEGVVSTYAGTAGSSGSTDGTASVAKFNGPNGVAVDGSGNVYVADTYNDTIRKITSAGVVSAIAGGTGLYGSTDGTGTAARFTTPFGVAVDGSGNVYVADNTNNLIRKITASGAVTTLGGIPGTSGSANGSGATAAFFNPTSVAVDGSGNLYVADSGNDTVRKGVAAKVVVTTYAGLAQTTGSTDGTASAARFYYDQSVVVDGSGNVYVADTQNQTIRKISSTGTVSTLAGLAQTSGSSDGSGSSARFNGPTGVAVDGSGNLYVADQYNATIRKITSAGVVSTLAGSAGNSGATDGSGSTAKFSQPAGVSVDGSGNVYVADSGNNAIRKITSAGLVSTLAGGSYGSSDGSGSAAKFSSPNGVAVDGSGNIFVADSYNSTIRKITSAGVVTTFAGQAGNTGVTDGSGSAALFSLPFGIAVDASGSVYVTDDSAQTIRKITSAGVSSTLASTPFTSGSTDGADSAARFDNPTGIAVDGSGNLFIADSGNSTVRKAVQIGYVSAAAPADLFGGVVTGPDLKRSAWFGHYTYDAYPLVYEYFLGYEYAYDAGGGGVYLYDYNSGHFWYTQASYFPFVYDFSLNTFLYYYQANTPHRHFYDYANNQVITE